MRIRREDVETVREKSRIEDVVGEHVSLRPAGVGSLKGLCPFHDEKSPSFHVRPAMGLWHCFGCDEGGDVISFVQRVEVLSFADAVERLAGRLNLELRYEDDGGGRGPRREGIGRRQRLLEANRVAAQYFAEQLATSTDGGPARQFLTDRGFDREAALLFGVGFAPRGGEVMLKHLRGRGFTEDELLASGLAGQGRSGLYDRFRGRLIWPIRDVTGDVVGFGARRIFEDDSIEAKYLNTPETAIYHKSQLLYGVDLAKREIVKARQVVVVEGYTDVMACHLAGVQTAVATCGTAFGADHIRVVRRLIGDDSRAGGKVIFTFDGDGAGQKAALRAYEEDQKFVAQTFIALAKDGMDPCDLRLKHGDEAVRALIESREPLFAFKIRSELGDVDLDTAEGRIQGLRKAAPVVAQIRDAALRPEYARQLAGWLGMEIEPVNRAVQQVLRQGPADASGREPAQRRGGEPPVAAPGAAPAAPPKVRLDVSDPLVRAEQQALACVLQVPQLLPAEDIDVLSSSAFRVPAFQAIFDAVRASGGMAVARTLTASDWIARVLEATPQPLSALVTELAVLPLPVHSDAAVGRYAVGMVLAISQGELNKRKADLHSRIQRAGPEDDGRALLTEVMEVEARLTALRARIHGS